MLLTWPWDSAETKFIKRAINNIVNHLVEKIGNRLIAIYLAGTILTSERKPESDIDLFCVVSSDFDFAREDAMNEYFKKHKKDLCGGRDTKFHGIPMSELEGGPAKSRITGPFGIPIRIMVKQFLYYKRLWGKRINFRKFPTHGISLEEVMEHRIKWAEMNVRNVKSGKFNRPYDDFIKAIIQLCNIDAQLNYGYKFDPSFKKLARHLKNEEEHIIHLCLEYRAKAKSLTKKERSYFLSKADEYVKDLKKKVKQVKT